MKKLFLSLIVLLALTARVEAAIAVVDSVKAASGGGSDFTSNGADWDTTGANLLVCVVSSYEPSAAPTLSDIKSNTWTGRTTYSLTGEALLRFYYATGPPTVGSGHTVTVTGSNAFAAVACIAFSGAHATAPYDQESGSTASAAATIQAGSVTPSENNAVVVVGIGLHANFASQAIDGGFTIQEEQAEGGGNLAVAIGYLIQTSAAAANPTWTPASGANRNSTANSATFKVAAAGGSLCNGGFLLRGVGGC